MRYLFLHFFSLVRLIMGLCKSDGKGTIPESLQSSRLLEQTNPDRLAKYVLLQHAPIVTCKFALNPADASFY